jgi:hypothetical protein
MSYKGEVIADNTGKFYSNGLRFETEKEAAWYVNDLASRWLLVTRTRVVQCDDPVNSRWEDHQLKPV